MRPALYSKFVENPRLPSLQMLKVYNKAAFR
jgi:hypothetical protein